MAALDAVIVTTSAAESDENSLKMTTFRSQWNNVKASSACESWKSLCDSISQFDTFIQERQNFVYVCKLRSAHED